MLLQILQHDMTAKYFLYFVDCLAFIVIESRRWYLVGPVSFYLLVSKRLSRKLLLASMWKWVKGHRHTFSVPRDRDRPWRSWDCWEPGGERAPLWCLEGRPHPAAALQAIRCLAKTWHRWRTVCVMAFTDMILGYVKCKSKLHNCFNK